MTELRKAELILREALQLHADMMHGSDLKRIAWGWVETAQARVDAELAKLTADAPQT